MPKTQESMRDLHRFYTNQMNECIELLIKSKELSSSIVEAREKCDQTKDDKHSKVVYGTYKNNLVEMMDLVRKLSVQLHFNELRKILDDLKIDSSSVEKPPKGNTSVQAYKKKLANGNSSVKHEEQQKEQTSAAPHLGKISSADRSDSKILVSKPTLVPAWETTSNAGSTSDCSKWRLNYTKPDLSAYRPDDIIWAIISYITDAARLRFYIVVKENENAPKIAKLAHTKHLRQYSELPGNEVFGLAIDYIIYRAVRERLDKATNSKVLLIDVGEFAEINNDSIMYHLGTELQQIPGLAISCELYDPQGTSNYELQEMLRRLEFEKIECQIKAVRGDMLQIKLIDLPRAEPRKATLDGPVESVPSRTENTNQPFYGELSAEDLEMLNDEPLGTTNAMKAVLGYDPKDDKRNCPFISATVTHITDVDRFYANLIDENNPMEPLMWVPSFISQKQRLKRLPKKFEIVMAQYQDGHWYRARVEETNGIGDSVRVFYVDYGNYQITNLNNLAHCDVAIAQLPYRAVLCRLANVRKTAISTEICKSAIHYLNQTLLNHTINVKVVSNHEDLWIGFAGNFGQEVLYEMKRMGVVEACETIVV